MCPRLPDGELRVDPGGMQSGDVVFFLQVRVAGSVVLYLFRERRMKEPGQKRDTVSKCMDYVLRRR